MSRVSLVDPVAQVEKVLGDGHWLTTKAGPRTQGGPASTSGGHNAVKCQGSGTRTSSRLRLAVAVVYSVTKEILPWSARLQDHCPQAKRETFLWLRHVCMGTTTGFVQTHWHTHMTHAQAHTKAHIHGHI